MLGVSGGGLGGAEGGQGGGREGSGRAPGGRTKKNHLVSFKIMGLCGGFSLLLKRLELMLNEFLDDFFLNIHFFKFFRVLYIRKFREFFSDEFYDKKIDFLLNGGWKLGNLE